jgi:glycosyltransferase involved in cell wall biosynthesis
MARVLISIHSLGLGGAERVALQWAGWLRQAGHEVLLLTGAGSADGSRGGAGGDFYALPEGVARREEPPLPAPLAHLGPLVFPLRVARLRRLLRRAPPDLVLAMTPRPAIKLLLAARGLPVPVVVAERNHPGIKPLPPLWRLLRRLTYPRAALLLVQTAAIAGWFQRHGPVLPTAVLPNAVPWPLPGQEPVVPPETLLATGTRVVLAAGTKPHQKGFDRLERAFAIAARRVPGWRLVIVGPAPPHPDPGGTRGPGAPLLPGRVGNMADWYRRADLFVLSSRYEGFPNVLLEAMASGTACLAVDCPSGPAELIRHDRSGWLVPAAGRSEAALEADLAEALATLMADGGRRARLADGAREVRRRFAEDRVRPVLLQLLEPWLGPPPP